MAKIKPPTTTIEPPKGKQKAPDKNSGKTSQLLTSKPPPDSLKLIQIRVPASMHQEIKIYAAENSITINDLLLNAYSAYRKENG